MIIMIEKTRMPKGSSRRRPTGNLCCNFVIFHCTNLFVTQMITVHNRSRAESASEAMRDKDEDVHAAAIFAMRRRILARTLICMIVSREK